MTNSFLPDVAARACPVLLALAVLACGAAPADASKPRPQVVFTVDVESNEAFDLTTQIDAVCDGGAPCGLMHIVRMLQERDWPATFFLNVYEHRRWGDAAVRNIAVRLQTAGQDLALHTHPQDAYDWSRWGMHQYSLDEQIAIVRDGVRLLEAWTGRPVIAHRAGAYAADRNTLTALRHSGILVDSSVFWKHPNTRLDDLGMRRNVPSLWDGDLVQIPVTAYEREDYPRGLGALLGPVRTVRKIDADWFTTESEMRAAIDAAIDADLPVIVVFLHSFSFMGPRSETGVPADRASIAMFRAILDHVARTKLQVVTMRDLAATGTALATTHHADVVPRVAVPVDVPHYVWRRLKIAGPGSRYAAAGTIFLVCVAALVVVQKRMGTTRRLRRRLHRAVPAITSEGGCR